MLVFFGYLYTDDICSHAVVRLHTIIYCRWYERVFTKFFKDFNNIRMIAFNVSNENLFNTIDYTFVAHYQCLYVT